jgi:DNA-binding response OmpR family regulator
MASPFQPLPKPSSRENKNENTGAGAPKGLPPLFDNAVRRKRILHVEFDRTLLATRHALLETAGFEVISCFNATAIREVSTAAAAFDLFLVGHAAPLAERNELVTWLRSNFPDAAVVVMRTREVEPCPAGALATGADPDDLLKTIFDVLKRR